MFIIKLRYFTFSGNFGAKGSHDMNLPGKLVTIDIFEFSVMLYFIPVKLCTFSLTGKVNLMFQTATKPIFSVKKIEYI